MKKYSSLVEIIVTMGVCLYDLFSLKPSWICPKLNNSSCLLLLDITYFLALKQKYMNQFKMKTGTKT